MTRVRDIEPSELAPELAAVYEEFAGAYGPFRNQVAVFARLRRPFSEAQIVELTLRIALCGFFNRFNDALQIEEEAAAASAVAALGD
jgi:alkylhydroperoxidase family enzyme